MAVCKIKNKLPSIFLILHPVSIFLYLSLMVLLIFLVKEPSLFYTMFLSMLYLFHRQIGLRKIYKQYGSLLLYAICFLLFQLLFNQRGATVIIYAFHRPFTLESLLYGLYAACLYLSVILLFVLMNKIIGSQKMWYLFSGKYPQLGFLAAYTMKLSLHNEAHEYFDIQRRRMPQQISKLAQMKQSLTILLSFASYHIETFMEKTMGLRAKEYGRYKRNTYEQYFISFYDQMFCFVVLLSFVILLSKLFKQVDFNYYRNFQTSDYPIYVYCLLFVFFHLDVMIQLFCVMSNLGKGTKQ